ncbi:MAG: response regulator [Clostridiales bacterium]|nr:response regulator [Clostridiales bacterium]MCF8023053.1 response regulator [Clostridiales bacterium]
METIKVMIADDIENTREDIKRLLYFEDDLEVIAESGDGEETIAMAQEIRPNVILMDINMPEVDGISATETISMEVPECAIIIISIQGEQEYLRKAMMAGAREFLVKPFSASELAETIRKIHYTHQKRVHFNTGGSNPTAISTKKRGQLITFFSTKGGTGKTTLAANMAVCLSQETGKSVALVDLDLTAGDCAILLNISIKETIADLVQEDQNNLDYEMVDSFLIPHLSGTKLLAAPASPEQAELVHSGQVEQIISTLRDNFDYVVVDTAPVYTETNLGVLEASSHVLLVLTQELPSLKQTTTALEILKTLNYTPRVQVILNQHSNDAGIKAADLEKNINQSLCTIIPDDRKTVRSAINKGLPFVMAQASSRMAESTRELINTLGLASPEDICNDNNKKSVISKIFSF